MHGIRRHDADGGGASLRGGRAQRHTGVCCFGEQGMDAGRRTIHGNLMFGCLLFSNKMRDEADECPVLFNQIQDER